MPKFVIFDRYDLHPVSDDFDPKTRKNFKGFVVTVPAHLAQMKQDLENTISMAEDELTGVLDDIFDLAKE